MASPDPTAPPPDGLQQNWAELVAAFAFLTRLPVPAAGRPPPPLAAAAWTFPLVGVAIGLIGGVVLAVAVALGLPPLLAAALSLAAAVAATGALHEDGLADTLDGFGGGRSVADKLAIMRDSRIGSYGAAGLMLTLLIRATALAALPRLGTAATILILVAAEAASRAAMVQIWHDLPPARSEGLSHAAGRPDQRATFTTLILAGLIVLVLTLPAAGPWATLIALAGTAAAAITFTRLCRAQIGGQTGDTLGAAQQAALATFLILVLAFA